MNTTYVPGVCNIGPEEIKGRRASGWFGLVLTIAVGAVLIMLPVSPWTRLVLFFPAAIGALGFLQAGFHFCVAYGTQGLFSMGNGTESVSQQEFRKQDQVKSVKIITYSVLIGIVVAVGSVFI
ncbi:MAG: hypothetical protein AB199_01010 [Parcubacteria bacterium C7867-004]|nr:MAG: hypothetical protein AB199_01010 [Parcubacteria bacterium C7867-004]